MRKVAKSAILALLLMVVLALTVYSQSKTPATLQVLQGGINQQIPLDITLLVPSESGVQTVTVPIVLNLSLSVGPVNAIDLDVKASQPIQSISPITTVNTAVNAADGALAKPTATPKK